MKFSNSVKRKEKKVGIKMYFSIKFFQKKTFIHKIGDLKNPGKKIVQDFISVKKTNTGSILLQNTSTVIFLLKKNKYNINSVKKTNTVLFLLKKKHIQDLYCDLIHYFNILIILARQIFCS